MSNQTCGVSARILLSTFHVRLVYFSPQSLQNWIGTLGLQKSPYLSDRPALSKPLAPQDWVEGAKGITFLSALNAMVIIHNRVCQESLHAPTFDIFEKKREQRQKKKYYINT